MCRRLEAHTKRDLMKFPPEPQGEPMNFKDIVSSHSRETSAVIKEEGIGLLPVPVRVGMKMLNRMVPRDISFLTGLRCFLLKFSRT
jgi:hypothetical protein